MEASFVFVQIVNLNNPSQITSKLKISMLGSFEANLKSAFGLEAESVVVIRKKKFWSTTLFLNQ